MNTQPVQAYVEKNFIYTQRPSRVEGLIKSLSPPSSETGASAEDCLIVLIDPEAKLFMRFIALIALNHLCQRRLARYLLISWVSRLLMVSKYVVVNHL